MHESKFEKDFMKKVEKLPGAYVPPKIDPGAVRGLPDRVFCINGRYCALEFKKSKSESTSRGRAALQKYMLKQIEQAGGYTSFVFPENADFVMDELEHIAKGEDIR